MHYYAGQMAGNFDCEPSRQLRTVKWTTTDVTSGTAPAYPEVGDMAVSLILCYAGFHYCLDCWVHMTGCYVMSADNGCQNLLKAI